MSFNLPNSIYEELRRDDGYRPNIGIVLMNRFGKVLWARRAGRDGWQFPQGGVERHESLDEALFRELYEEVGLEACHVNLLAHTSRWMRYDLPGCYLRRARYRPIACRHDHADPRRQRTRPTRNAGVSPARTSIDCVCGRDARVPCRTSRVIADSTSRSPEQGAHAPRSPRSS